MQRQSLLLVFLLVGSAMVCVAQTQTINLPSLGEMDVPAGSHWTIEATRSGAEVVRTIPAKPALGFSFIRAAAPETCKNALGLHVPERTFRGRAGLAGVGDWGLGSVGGRKIKVQKGHTTYMPDSVEAYAETGTYTASVCGQARGGLLLTDMVHSKGFKGEDAEIIKAALASIYDSVNGRRPTGSPATAPPSKQP